MGESSYCMYVMLVVGMWVLVLKMMVFLWWRPRRVGKHFADQGISGPPYRFFIGNVKEIVQLMVKASAHPMPLSHNILPRVLSFYHQWKKIYGATFLVWFGPTARLMVADPDLIREIFVSKSEFYEKYESHPLVRRLEGDGLLSLKGERWAHRRKIITPTFHMENLKLLIPVIGSSVLDMVRQWAAVSENGEVEIDVSDAFQSLTEDVITQTTFGRSYHDGKAVSQLQAQQMVFAAEAFRKVFIPGYREEEQYELLARDMSLYHIPVQCPDVIRAADVCETRFESFATLHLFIQRIAKLPAAPYTSVQPFHATVAHQLHVPSDEEKHELLETGQADQKVSGEVSPTTERKFRGEKPSGSSAKDLLGLMINARGMKPKEHSSNASRAPSTITVQDIIEECKAFFFAGKQTTSNLLTWTTVLLAMHPQWQELARDEVLQVCGSRDIPTRDDIARLKTIGMIVHESLRLYPPAIATIRRAKADVELGSYRIPRGTELLIPILAVHHDKALWGDDAAEFNPARFTDGVARAAKHPLAFIPFGLGARTCIGQNLAIIEAKLALAIMLKHFQCRLAPSYRHAPTVLMLLYPQYGAPIIFRRLWGSDSPCGVPGS